MASARLAVGTCVASLSLAAAFQVQPSTRGGCKTCRGKRDLIDDDTWKPSVDMSKVYEASREGGLTRNDTDKLLEAVRKAGKGKSSFMVTVVTDGGMLELAQNMIRSLEAVPCQTPRLLIGTGLNLCGKFEDDARTTCVEVFQDAISENEVAWGTHEYWQVAFRKHVVLMVTAMSMVSRHVVYADPDVAFLDCPVPYLVHHYTGTHDIVFSPNNMLDPDAASVQDVADRYETRGMDNVLVGSQKRHADINTGLFFMNSSSAISDLMLETMRIFKEVEHTHGHYQQFSLAKALDELPSLVVGMADGSLFVNGNVFWGHRQLLCPDNVISVHANWMRSNLKVSCLREAGLWVDPSSPARPSRERWEDMSAVRMDASFAIVESCGAGPAGPPGDVVPAPELQQAQAPPAPTQPGCHLWLPSGCKAHRFNAQDRWRWMEDLTDPRQCQVDAKAIYNRWCGTEDAQTLFVGRRESAPAEPGEEGCYVWMPSGCERQNFDGRAAWTLCAEDDPSTCAGNVTRKFNAWCGTKDAQSLWVPTRPAVPKQRGCYAWLPTGCRLHPSRETEGWIRDANGEDHAGAGEDRASCERLRKGHIDMWCGVSNTQMMFVE